MVLPVLDFPPSPTVGQTFPSPPVTGQPTYSWDGATWISKFALGREFVALDGSTPMTGLLTLFGDPVNALHAVTKQYLTGATTGFVSYAPQTLTAAQQSQARANIDVTRKNYIVNGAMQVSQENKTTAGTTSNYYPVDQWFTTITSGTVSIAQVAAVSPAGSPNRIRCTTTGAATFNLEQKIEGLRIADLLLGTASAKTFTVQIGVKAPAGTHTITVSNAAKTNSGGGTFTIATGEANTDVVKSVTISSGLTEGIFPVDNSAAVWLQIIFGSATGVVELFDVSLTEGTVAPPFQVPDYAKELSVCQRYLYRRDYSMNGQMISTLQAYSTIQATGSMLEFPTTMRATPTAAAGGTFGLTNTSGNSAGAVTGGTFICSIDQAYVTGAFVGAGGLVPGDATLLFVTGAPAMHQFNARM